MLDPHLLWMPLFYFDFNGKNYQNKNALETVLDSLLKQWETEYHIAESLALEERFKRLLRTACGQTGKRCVILVDEYDKPLLECMVNQEQVEHNKAVFKVFFGALKSEDV